MNTTDPTPLNVYVGNSYVGKVVLVPGGARAVPRDGEPKVFTGSGYAETWLRERILEPSKAEEISRLHSVVSSLLAMVLLASGCFEDVIPEGNGTNSTSTGTDTGGTSSSTGSTGPSTDSTTGTSTDSGSTSAVSGSTGTSGSTGPPGSTGGSTGSTGGSTGSTGAVCPGDPGASPALTACDNDCECESGACFLPEGLGGSPQGFCLNECFNGLDCPDPEAGANVGCADNFVGDGTKHCFHGCPTPGFVNNCPEGWLCYDVGSGALGQAGTCFPYP